LISGTSGFVALHADGASTSPRLASSILHSTMASARAGCQVLVQANERLRLVKVSGGLRERLGHLRLDLSQRSHSNALEIAGANSWPSRASVTFAQLNALGKRMH
jgi:hypothetical protein